MGHLEPPILGGSGRPRLECVAPSLPDPDVCPVHKGTQIPETGGTFHPRTQVLFAIAPPLARDGTTPRTEDANRCGQALAP